MDKRRNLTAIFRAATAAPIASDGESRTGADRKAYILLLPVQPLLRVGHSAPEAWPQHPESTAVARRLPPENAHPNVLQTQAKSTFLGTKCT